MASVRIKYTYFNDVRKRALKVAKKSIEENNRFVNKQTLSLWFKNDQQMATNTEERSSVCVKIKSASIY